MGLGGRFWCLGGRLVGFVAGVWCCCWFSGVVYDLAA